jgi:putative colanic acid biosysnthesis UDP-glucose lipid carrier transferase
MAEVPWSEQYTLLMIESFILSFICFYSSQLYRSWRGRKLYKEFVVILKAWATTVGIILFSFFILKSSHTYSRAVIISWFLLSPVIIFAVHLCIRQVLHVIRSKGKNLKEAVIVGAGSVGVQLAHYIENMPWAGIKVTGFFDDFKKDGDVTMNWPVLGTIDQLPDFLRTTKMTYVYIALPTKAGDRMSAIISEVRTLGAALYLVPDLFTFKLHNAQMDHLGDMLLYNFNPIYKHKRYFDVLFSLLVLIISLPVTLFIALLIKLEDGGPVLYRHRRVTTMGKEFGCLKFRTMCVGADQKLSQILREDPKAKEEWQQTYKLKSDPRVTWFGRFLRKTSLDELPQFINVLKGEMSVVGARPVVHSELSRFYREDAGLYCSMKPGITGPWQICKRSDTEDYSERVRLDTWYVLNHSIWLDCKIILKTLSCMVNGKGAY